MVNRGALLLRYREPAVRWINEADTYPRGSSVTLRDVNEERTVYLISDKAADSPESLERWIKRHYVELFEAELEGWYTDPDLWPKQKTYKMFSEWFEVECHTVLLDLAGGGIYDDET